MTYRMMTLLVAITLWGAASVVQAQNGPDYASVESKRIIERMIEAHGGMERWRSSKTSSFEHTLYMPSMPAGMPRWMISKEVFDQQTRRAYADYPLWNAQVANDNERVWSVNWKFPNPPSQMIGIHYYFAFLPWLSQDASVNLGEPGTGTLPDDETAYLTVPMTFDVGEGEQSDTWTFFIHPETYMMDGFSITFAANGATAKHKIASFAEADGLKIPNDWMTMVGPEDRVIGFHAIIDIAFDGPFEEARLRMPANAVVDTAGSK